METVYGEKEALDDALTSVKTATGNYNTFSNECVHENVRNVMLKILEQEKFRMMFLRLCMIKVYILLQRRRARR